MNIMVSLTVYETTTIVLSKEVVLIHSKGSDEIDQIEPQQNSCEKKEQPICDHSKVIINQTKGETKNKKKNNNEVRNPSFLCACVSKCGTFLAAASDDKKLTLWHKENNFSKWNFLSSREVLRKSICLQFTHNGCSVLVADRGGDIYDFSVTSPHQKSVLLLGHLSMLLDLLITPDDKYVITCDRDEKIRVSHYPNTYNILTYCLGHTEFITSMCLCGPHLCWLSSGSGDGTIRIWSYREGIQLCSYRYEKDTERATASGTVRRLCSSSDGLLVAAIFIGCNSVTLYSANVDENPRLIRLQSITLLVEPWDIQFDQDHDLVVLVVNDQQILSVYGMDKGQFNQKNVDETRHSPFAVYISTHSDLYKKITEEEQNDFSFLQKQWFDNVQQYLEKKRKRQEEKKSCKKSVAIT